MIKDSFFPDLGQYSRFMQRLQIPRGNLLKKRERKVLAVSLFCSIQ